MGFNNSVNMNLPIPQVGNEAGPQYATDVNNCLTLVDGHNHTPGYGVQITPNGLNINADLPMNANNLTTTRTVRFSSQPAVLTGVSDIGCLYEVVNDLFFNDGLGNNIRLTQSGSIAGTSGSIANLVPPASASYVTITKTIVFQSNTNRAANLDAGFIILRTAAISSPGLTLSVPATISSDYNIALPLLPASTLPVSIDSSGNMSTGQITTAQIASAAITTPLIAAGAVTRPTQAAVGQQISSSCGVFNTTSGSPVDITNLSITITTTGRPVMLFCQPDGDLTNAGFFNVSGSSADIFILRDATNIFNARLAGQAGFYEPSAVFMLDTPAAGTYTYKVQASISAASFDAFRVKFVAYEL